MTGATGPKALDDVIVRILGASGEAVGLGFLVSEVLVVTCAHVVTAAAGDADGEGAVRLRVDLPLSREGAAHGPVTAEVERRFQRAEVEQRFERAEVERWFERTEIEQRFEPADDMAVLRLEAPVPGGRPVRMIAPTDVWEHRVRMFGFPRGRPGGVWHSGVLRGRQADGWLQADLAAATGYQVAPGFSGGPVWDEKLGGVIGMVVAAEAGTPPSSYLIPADRMFAVWPELYSFVRPPSPFRGLAAFTEADAEVFYGRRREAEELAGLVLAEPRVWLVGPSGSGKSSLAMAGVAPRLRERGFEVAVVRPGTGSRPLDSLAAALLPLLEPESAGVERISGIGRLADILADGGLANVAAELGGRLLVIVDQFEELFVRTDRADREPLLDALFDGGLPESVRVLVTLRADFLGRVMAEPGLDSVDNRRLYPLYPMTGDRLREIVVAPVEAVPGVAYAEGVVDRILEDAGTEPGALPLIAFTLDLLWQRQGSDGRLTLSAYEALGRVTGALSMHAENVWSEHVPRQDESAARRLFTRLIRLPYGAMGPHSGGTEGVRPDGVEGATKVTVLQSDLDEDELRIARRLAATRLLVTGEDANRAPTVELAHETLIGRWARLRDWTVRDSAFLVWRESLRQDVERWERESRPPERLPTGTTLAEAETWLPDRAAELTRVERDYLEQGRARLLARTRRRRGLISGLGAVVVVTAVLASLLVYQRHVSADEAATSDSRALAENSADEAKLDPARSLMLALAAYRTAHTSEARNALLRGYLTYSQEARVLSGLLGQLGRYQSSRDGNVVVARSLQGRALLYFHAATGRVRTEELPSTTPVVYPLVSADGRRAGYVASDGTVVWFEVVGRGGHLVGPPHRLMSRGEPTGAVLDVGAAMTADGRQVVTTTSTEIVWWDTATGRATVLPLPGHATGDVWFGPGGGSILLGTFSGSSRALVSVDRSTGSARTVVSGVDEFEVSGDGSAVVTCQKGAGGLAISARSIADGTVQDVADRAVRGVADGAVRGRTYTTKQEDYCPNLSVDASGHRATVDGVDTKEVVDLDKGTEISAVTGLSNDFTASSALVGSGTSLSLVGTVGNAIVFVPLPAGPGELSVAKAALSPDGRRMISVLEDGSRMQVRAVPDGRLLADVARREPLWRPGDTDRISQSADGRLLADREGMNVVVVRSAGTLRETSEVTTAMPPGGGQALSFAYFFDAAGRLVTLSGSLLQLWDPHTGRQLARFDAAVFRLAAGSIQTAPLPKGDQVSLVAVGAPGVRVVDLATGRLVATIRTGGDTEAVKFDASGRYLALLRSGSTLELWRLHPLRREIGPLPSVADTENGSYATAFIGNGRFMLAANDSVRVYDIAHRSVADSYDFGGSTDYTARPYSFLGISANGRTVLYGQSESATGGPLVLDPGLWSRTLCNLIGDREFTSADRVELPVKIPTAPVCPSS